MRLIPGLGVCRGRHWPMNARSGWLISGFASGTMELRLGPGRGMARDADNETPAPNHPGIRPERHICFFPSHDDVATMGLRFQRLRATYMPRLGRSSAIQPVWKPAVPSPPNATKITARRRLFRRPGHFRTEIRFVFRTDTRVPRPARAS
jgi:hypothetical protein